MKRLTLLRHARTESDAETGRDFDRRLNEQGRADARRMGEEIRAAGLEFDRVISSPAARAGETAELAGLSPRFDPRIYDASAGQLLAIVEEVDDETERLMLIGHNPGFERLASRLVGEAMAISAGALLEIHLPVDQWQEVGSVAGRLVRFIRPGDLV